MASFPPFKTKIAPLSSKNNQRNHDSSIKTIYSPYFTMDFRPNLTQTCKGTRSSKGLERNSLNKKSFEDYLIEGYGVFNNNESDLKNLNQPAFELVWKNQKIKEMKDLGLRIV